MSDTTFCIAITEANHAENEFYQLGGAGFLTDAERQANLATIPRFEHDCQDPTIDRCYRVDILNPDDQFTIDDEFEITEETAHALLGVEDFEPLREGERAMLRLLDEVTR